MSAGIAAVATAFGVAVGFWTGPVDGLLVGFLLETMLETLNASYKEREYALRQAELASVRRGAEVVSNLAAAGAFIQESDHADLLTRELDLRVAEFDEHLDHLRRGRIVREGMDVSGLLLNTHQCQKSLRATTTLRAASVGTPE
ncbi:MAG: hypothetical protein ACXVWZ_07575, partial [Nocardioides sp.]